MGILYKETVIYKRQWFAKFAFYLTLLIFSVDAVMLISNPREFFREIAYVGYAMLPIAIIISVFVWQKCKTRYKYSIIDNELIIEKIKGNKRRLELNVNIKQIVAIDRGSEKKQAIEKEYNFTCGCKKHHAYRCLFSKEGKLYSFYFEPSSTLISRLGTAVKNRLAV